MSKLAWLYWRYFFAKFFQNAGSLEANDLRHDNCKATNFLRVLWLRSQEGICESLHLKRWRNLNFDLLGGYWLHRWQILSLKRRPNISFEIVPNNGEIWASRPSTYRGCGRIDSLLFTSFLLGLPWIRLLQVHNCCCFLLFTEKRWICFAS